MANRGDELPIETAVAEARAAEDEQKENGMDETNGDNIIHYSKDELLQIRKLPLSLRRPECLTKPKYSTYSCWALNKKTGELSLDDEKGSRDINEKRRPGDPRERLRKESEGIVLSPQRRSFNSGCYVMGGNINATRLRPDSPIFSQDQKAEHGSRDSRRIGSGRILQRDMTGPWERGVDLEDTLGGPPDFNNIYRPPGAQRDRGDDRFDRRSFGRDLYLGNDKGRTDRDRDRDSTESRFGDRKEREDGRRNNRYGNDKKRTPEKDEEPEWFSGGPTSQNETIELRGFDEPHTHGNATSAAPTSGTATSTADTTVANTATSTTDSVMTAKIRPRRSAGSGRTPSAIAANQENDKSKVVEMYKEEISKSKKECIANSIAETEQEPSKQQESSDKDKSAPDESRMKVDSLLDFNMDDIFKIDLMSGLQANGGHDNANLGGSKFSRWFKRESPIQGMPNMQNEPERVQEISDQMFNIIRNNLETSISIPGNDSQHVFAPISPAANTSTPPHNSLLDILRRGSQQPHSNKSTTYPPHKTIENMPKIHSLQELEAHMRGPSHPPQQSSHPIQRVNPNNQQISQDEATAFKRLLAQIYEGQAVSASNGPMVPPNHAQPMSIMQMLNKSQQADQAALESHHHHDLLKVLQIPQNQPENMNKMMQGNINHTNRHFQISPIPNDVQPHMQSHRDLLQRPEAQAMLHGLNHGEITVQHLMQQMGNPNLQSRNRDVIGSVIKFYQNSPRNRLVPPQQPPQQQLRISPLPPNAYCVSPIMATSPNTLNVPHSAINQRIPSPRELQAHTQSIMQGALIKKKLEEQRENFRRRQEQTVPLRATTPAPVPSPTKHPAALAFTPTSVLRNMSADKEAEHILPKAAGWGAPPLHSQQGTVPKHARPIVKGNSSNIPVQQPYQPNPPDYHQPQYLNHQQQQFSSMQQQQQAAAARTKMGHPSHHQFHAMVMQMRQQNQQNQAAQALQGNNRGPIPNNGPSNLQQLLNNQHLRNHNDNSNTAPALSPTSNQLARWFSPELLAQATAGKLPSVNMAPNVLSLEELERMQHNEAIVHN